MQFDYMIQPIIMGGVVKEVTPSTLKIHLHGRLGVITIPRILIIDDKTVELGQEMKFYFSYIQVVEHPYDYDSTDMVTTHEITPCLLGGTIIEVNDTAAKIAVMNQLGIIAVPRRWLFTPVPLREGLTVEFYFSCMEMTDVKRNIPQVV